MLQADVEAHTCPKCGKPGNWRKYNGLHLAQPVTSHGGGSISYRAIYGLVLIVVAGCLFAHVIIGFIEGGHRG